MRADGEDLQALRRAIAELADAEAAEVVNEARMEARVKVRSILAEAMAELKALAQRNDHDFDSLKQLAQWLNEVGKPEEARKALQEAMYVNPFEQESHQLLAELCFKHKDLRLALREYRALLALDPTDKAAAHFNVANILWQMGQKSEAKKEVLAALEIAPGFEPAQELLLKVVD